MTTALTAPVQNGGPSPSTAVARPRMGLLRPIAKPAAVLEAAEETRSLIQEALVEDRDYGVIPGTDTDTKPGAKKRLVLFKAGAERVAIAFGCYYGEPEIVEREVDHDRVVEWIKKKKKWEDRKFVGWGEERGTSIGLYRYVLRIPVIHAESGATVGYGIGSCSTLEGKYVDRPRESENTVIKMAHKRGMVAAALIAFGLSDQFTQDVEEQHPAATATAPATAAVVVEDDAPPLTLELALATVFPWKQPEKFAGKKFGEIPSKVLARMIDTLEEKLEDVDDPILERLHAAANLVLESRHQAEARELERRVETPKEAAPAAQPDPTRSAPASSSGGASPSSSTTAKVTETTPTTGSAGKRPSESTVTNGSTAPPSSEPVVDPANDPYTKGHEEATVAQLDAAAQKAAAMEPDPIPAGGAAGSIASLIKTVNEMLADPKVPDTVRREMKRELLNMGGNTAENARDVGRMIGRLEREFGILPF